MKDRGCHTLLSPMSSDLWKWAIQMKCDWLIDDFGHGGGGESTFTCTRGYLSAAEGCGLMDPLVKKAVAEPPGRDTEKHMRRPTREERHMRDWRELSWKVLNSCLHRVLKNQRCWKATRLSLAVFGGGPPVASSIATVMFLSVVFYVWRRRPHWLQFYWIWLQCCLPP